MLDNDAAPAALAANTEAELADASTADEMQVSKDTFRSDRKKSH